MSGRPDGGRRTVPDGGDADRATDVDENWDESDVRVTKCERCPELAESRSQIVNGTGSVDADVLFVGEGPGADEDAQGEPFVGRSDGVLDAALEDAGVERADVRITNSVRCRPPENRDPRAAELENCRPYLEREVAAVDPALVVALGKVPSEHLLGRDVAVTNETGATETVELGDRPRDVMICLHPAASLYDRSQREAFDESVAAAVAAADGPGQSGLGDF